ncbi:MAG: hypothetical protein EXR57_04220 [Dehalococcoidia bacterium]|nr:hypothetical protein [Dehalococcoidia bacterium]MSQ35005.1 hypothetical protein [Dehalococcoidia bacterium]
MWGTDALGLFGRKDKEKVEVQDWPRLSTIVKVEESLRQREEITPARTAGVLYRHSDLNPFLKDIETNMREALNTGEGATQTGFRFKDEDGGLRWAILEDTNFRDLASSTYTAGNAIASNGAKDCLIAAVFLFNFTHSVRETDTRSFLRSYWIYRYTRHAYYPFVPTSDKEGDRDRPSELELARLVHRAGLEVDRELEEWRGLWGIPF